MGSLHNNQGQQPQGSPLPANQGTNQFLQPPQNTPYDFQQQQYQYVPPPNPPNDLQPGVPAQHNAPLGGGYGPPNGYNSLQPVQAAGASYSNNGSAYNEPTQFPAQPTQFPPQPNQFPPQPNQFPPQPNQLPPQPSFEVSYGYIPDQIDEMYRDDAAHDAKKIMSAFNDTSIDFNALLSLLPKLSALQIQTLKFHLKDDFKNMLWRRETLLSSSQNRLSHIVNQTMRGLLMGPCDFEAWLLYRALGGTDIKPSTPQTQKSGGGLLARFSGATRKVTNVVSQSAPTLDRMTPLSVLKLVLLGRKNGDIVGIKRSYEARFPDASHSILEKLHTLYPDISAKTSNFPLGEDYKDGISLYRDSSEKFIYDPRYRLFATALEARRTADFAYDVSQDVKALDIATTGKFNAAVTIEILVTRSSGHLSTVAQAFAQQGQRKTLARVLSDKLDGTEKIVRDMKECFCWILDGFTVKDAAARDAKALETTMKGIGTQEDELVTRLVLYHWDKAYFNQVKQAYVANKDLATKKYPNLAARVKSDTSGDDQKLLLAITY